LPSLQPSFALADCVINGIWIPDPDDIEWDQVDIEELRKAFDCLGAEIPEIWSDEIDYLGCSGPGM
ncbi:unnamed protein product, partial [Laminaria digitata]